jgi:hypothetical protein
MTETSHFQNMSNITTKVTVIIERTESESSFILKSHSKVVKEETSLSQKETNDEKPARKKHEKSHLLFNSLHF